MSIQFGDILRHNNPNYPITDVTDIKGGLRSIATFSGDSLISEYTSGASGSIIPEKYKSGYSLLLETSTGTIYYYSGTDPTNVSHWSSIGIGGNGITNTIPKWITPSKLGNSSITDNGDTVVISSNLMVIGTTSTINTENLLVKDPIILLAGSQSGTPTYDAGLFVNRGSSDTQAFIWDESEEEFKFISTTSDATVSGDVSIGTYSTVRTGVLSVGTGTQSNVTFKARFIVSSSGGTVSLIVDENGYVYNRGRGNISSNTAFGLLSLGVNTTGFNNTAIGASALSLNTSGSYNTAIGQQSLMSNSFGLYNTGLGHQSLNQNTTGYYNTSVGVNSMRSNKSGYYNTSVGANSLYYNTTSYFSTAIGYNSLYKNISGNSNTAIGYQSSFNTTTVISAIGTLTPGSGYITNTYTNVPLIYATGSTAISYPTVDITVDGSGLVSSVTLVTFGSGFQDYTTVMTANNSYLGNTGSGFQIGIGSLVNGSNNTALGYQSLYSNTSGNTNTAIGYQSLYSNIDGYQNLAVGYQSLYSNTTGDFNTAIGYQSLNTNTTGTYNTSNGYQSLRSNTIGSNNTALGYQSLYYNTNGYQNTAVGEKSLYYNSSATNSVGIGYYALYKNNTGNWNTAVGVESLRNNTTIVTALAPTFSAGNGYTPGTYSNIVLFGYNVSYYPGGNVSDYPQVTIVVGVGGTVSSVTLTFGGTVIPDETIQFYIQTGSLPYQIPGGGSGFRINVASIGRAGANNVALGFNSLNEIKTGSRNVALGSNAGEYWNLQNANDSIYIGYGANSWNWDVSNEIVIGATALGNGSNTVTLGNDNIQKTYLKGNVGIGTDPSTKLHIYSTQSGAFRLEDGTQSYPGYVLTSDANGVGTWQGNPQITITSATATALATWNNTLVMCNRSGQSIITIPDTGLPPNFSFRFIVISSNTSATIAFTYSSSVSILPNTLVTFAQYESGVIDRFGNTQNYYITY